MEILNMESDIVYVFKIKDEWQYALTNTTCKHKFAGTIAADLRGTLVIQLIGSGNAYVIVPKEAILTMAPSEIHWQMRQQKDVLTSLKQSVPEKYMF